MSTNFPGAADDGTTLPNPGANAPTNNPSLSAGQTNQNDAIKAIEAKVGTGASTPSVGKVFRGTGSGTSAWGALDVTTDLTGVLPVANGGTGLTVLTIPASAILVGTTDVQDVTNKTLHDTFMGETFMSQSATLRNVLLDGSINYLVTELVEIGAAFNLEVPATSSLEIRPFHNTQSFTSAQHDHSSAAGGGLINNLYKFSGYMNAASQSVSTTQVPMACDTKKFDTNNNLDVTTNKGRYTVPVSGYYQFESRARATPAVGGFLRIGIAVNGVVVSYGNISRAGSAVSVASVVAALVQCTVGDYVESYIDMDAVNTITGGNAFDSYFMGYMVST